VAVANVLATDVNVRIALILHRALNVRMSAARFERGSNVV
jgi:hypothetical protein